MTRLFSRGFESGILTTEVDIIGSTPFVNTGVPRTGLYKFGTNSTSDSGGWDFPGTDQIYMGTGFYIDDLTSNNNQDFLVLASSDSNIALRAFTNSTINAMRGGSSIASSSPFTFTLDTWHYLELWVLMADASGRVVLKADGNIIIDFTGDTLSGSSVNMTRLTVKGQQSIDIYFDDLVVNDDAGSVNNTWPGIVSLEPIFPDSAGDQTDLQRGGTDSGNNWDQVDEQPSSAADYVFDTVVNDYDLYNAGDFTLPAGATIANVIVQGRLQLDSGQGSGVIILKAGSTESEGPAEALSAAWALFEITRDENPDTTSAWTEANVDALQIGMKVK